MTIRKKKETVVPVLEAHPLDEDFVPEETETIQVVTFTDEWSGPVHDDPHFDDSGIICDCLCVLCRDGETCICKDCFLHA